MEIELTIKGQTEQKLKIESSILSHAIVCHSLQLHEWQEKEHKKLAEYLRTCPERDDAIDRLNNAYDELENIEKHREANDKLKEMLHAAVFHQG